MCSSRFMSLVFLFVFFFSSRRRHTRCALVTGVQTCALPILDPAVRLIDFTGSSVNGNWLEQNARQAQVYTEKAGVNQVIIDSVDDFKSVARNQIGRASCRERVCQYV